MFQLITTIYWETTNTMKNILNKLMDFFFHFGVDRYIHFTVSLVLTILIAGTLGIAGVGSIALAIAPAFVMALGVAKEFYDKKTTGRFDRNDIVSDFLGIFLAVVLMVLVIASGFVIF